MACIPPYKEWSSSVCSSEVTACLHGGVCCNLHARQVFLRGSREMELNVPCTATGYGTVAGSLPSDLPAVLSTRSFFGGLSGYIKCGNFLD
jgi:hypothetical protein